MPLTLDVKSSASRDVRDFDSPVPTRRPIFRYAVLAILFAITVAYEIAYLSGTLQDEKF